MKTMKKFLSLLLVAVLVLSILAGCSTQGGASSSDGVITPSSEWLTDEEGNPVEVTAIGTINSEAVPFEEFRYYFLNYRDYYQDQLGEEIWDQSPEFLDSIKQQSLEALQFDRVMRQFAEAKGIVLTEEERKAAVDDSIAASIEQLGGEEAYQKALADSYRSEALYRTLLESQALMEKLQAEMMKGDGLLSPSDEEAKKLFDEQYLHAKHILISTQGITDEAELAAKLETANQVLARAKAGEDFDALVAEYGEDPGMQSTPEGYYFGEGEMVDEFYNGAKALEENGISDLVETSYGYHIIQRLPIEADYFEQHKDALKQTMTYNQVNQELMDAMQNAVVEKDPVYDLVTIKNIK